MCHRVTCEDCERKECIHVGRQRVDKQYFANTEVWIINLDSGQKYDVEISYLRGAYVAWHDMVVRAMKTYMRHVTYGTLCKWIEVCSEMGENHT